MERSEVRGKPTNNAPTVPLPDTSVDFAQFVQVVHMIENFWLTMVKLPPKTV
jgi:hypothetical protein